MAFTYPRPIFTHWLYIPGNDAHEPFLKAISILEGVSMPIDDIKRKGLGVFPYNGGRRPNGYEDVPTKAVYKRQDTA